MKNVLKMLVCIFLLASTTTYAQSPRMKRDVAVMETVLEQIVKEKGLGVGHRNKAEANYFQNFGILIKMPPIQSAGNGDWEDMEYPDFREITNMRNFEYRNFDKDIHINGTMERRDKINRKEVHKMRKEDEKMRKEADKMQKEADKMKVEVDKMQKEVEKNRKNVEQTRDSVFKKDYEKITEVMKSFLMQYGDLAPELKTEEKIKIIYETKRLYASIGNKNNGLSSRIISAEVTKQAIDDYKANKISEKEFLSKINIDQISKNEKQEYRDFEILANIFDKVAIAEPTFLPIGDTDYTYLEGFGVTFSTKLVKAFIRMDKLKIEYFDPETNKPMKMSVNPEKGKNTEVILGNGSTIYVNDNNTKKDDASEKEKIKISMEKIEKEAKEYIILYGRTLRSLKDTEQLVWEINFGPEWEGKGNSIQLAVPKKTLLDYDQRKISLEQATTQIQVTKNTK